MIIKPEPDPRSFATLLITLDSERELNVDSFEFDVIYGSTHDITGIITGIISYRLEVRLFLSCAVRYTDSPGIHCPVILIRFGLRKKSMSIYSEGYRRGNLLCTTSATPTVVYLRERSLMIFQFTFEQCRNLARISFFFGRITRNFLLGLFSTEFDIFFFFSYSKQLL